MLGTLEGNFVDLKTDDIDERVPLKVPLMPANLVDLLTVNEFRNLLAFLDRGMWTISWMKIPTRNRATPDTNNAVI